MSHDHNHDHHHFRYCPQCGSQMHTRRILGRPREACPHCGYVHFIDPKVGAGVLVEKDGAVLLVRRAVAPEKDKWCLPAGFVEYDEAPDAAAARECREETGLEVQIFKLLTVDQYFEDSRGPGIIIFYQACITGGELVPGDDANEAKFFEPDRLPDAIAFRTHRDLLSRWRDRAFIDINCPDAV
jgi:ADP-ribose pyrophosphatase YjhB (NUDIX family)